MSSEMNWIGRWKNQYGSILEITHQEDGMLQGYFESAVDETTKGEQLLLTGVCRRNLIALTCAGGDHVVTYAGMFYEGKMQTMWQVVTDEVIGASKGGALAIKKPLAWWQSVKTNADTFERM
ncbi:MAG: hypothetical protein J7623_04845 [Chitinophaga sp.]|uniref:avidin/streptavidin family protein n=1 Tax=Chitinophaga sp. TaxID=1869181 RepID=UPI001AFECCA5|nr:avidin/streptavidin family protein [Chitinophaga sp.]MBO9727945.1 hypothetical protein [Chitinophaga sp.]